MPAQTPDATPEARAMLASLHPRLAALADETANWWLTHGVDSAHGGFHGTLDRRGNPTRPTDKGSIQQSRHLWAFSTWYERRSPTAKIRTVADNTYAFIATHLRDAGDGEFYFKAGDSGSAVDRNKNLYAQAFAIYGLSTYGRVFGVKQARDHALACFRSIDARAHDETHGGYSQADDPHSWLDGSGKGTNTHIHLMEAFTALYEATRDPDVRAGLSELADLIVSRLLQPAGYVHVAFSTDWTPQGSPVASYGHDLETAWLLMDAARVLGRQDEQAIIDAALAMGLHSSERGYDPTAGGYFYEGIPGGAVTNHEKVWWVEFEALSGLWWMFQLTGDLVHLQRMEGTLAWLENMRDAQYGEWFWGHNQDGSVGPRGENKGEEWKSSYHNLRSLVFTADWIAEAIG